MKQLIGVLVFLVVSGCGVKRLLEPGDAGSGDAGSLPPCHCAVDGNVLTYSWECFCASGGCASAMPATTCTGTRVSQVACGLRSDSILTPGGPFIQVFDANGTLVGQEIGSDTGDFECPDDPSLRGFVRHVGTFPDAGCAATTCACENGNVDCAVDAGVTAPCGCVVDGDTLTYSWDCFCASHDCTALEPQVVCGPYPPTVACGLRTDQFQNIGGTNLRVFENGVLVGAQLRDDTPSFACPDDSSMVGSTLRAGTFADAGCAVTTCDCVDGGVACPSPPSCNCEVGNGALTMSMECFCAAFGCDDVTPQLTCPAYVESSMSCGLRLDRLPTPHRVAVFDNGVLVGREIYSDVTPYECPDDSTLHSNFARGGVFPDAGCSATACDCVDGGVACP